MFGNHPEFMMKRLRSSRVLVINQHRRGQALLLRAGFVALTIFLIALAATPSRAADCGKLQANLAPDAVEHFEAVKGAAQKSDHQAQYELARLYRVGHGVQQDLIRAYAWLNVAARSHREASEERDHIGRCLRPNEQVKAQVLSLELLSGVRSH